MSVANRLRGSVSKTAFALIVCVLAVRPALAQPASGAWTGRVRAGFSVGMQADSAGLLQSFTLVKVAEPAPISAELPSTTVPWFDGSVAVRLFRSAGVALSFSGVSRTGDADVSASIPHPFSSASLARSRASQASSIGSWRPMCPPST